jgi:hypothetical protein
MSFDTLGQLNWLAVIVGAVIYFALGRSGTRRRSLGAGGSAPSAGIPSASCRR